MHPPHFHEDIKHFGKAMLATFLGLLMALALEQWRERRHEAKLAEQGLASVETELKEDLVQVDRQIARCRESIQTTQTLEAYLGALIAAKRRGQPLPPQPAPGPLGIYPNFTADAWETFKGLGALRHIAPDRARRLSRAYLCFAGLRQNLDANPILRQIPGSLFVALEKPEDLPALDIPRLEGVREGVQLMRVFFRWGQNEMEQARMVCEAALKL